MFFVLHGVYFNCGVSFDGSNYYPMIIIQLWMKACQSKCSEALDSCFPERPSRFYRRSNLSFCIRWMKQFESAFFNNCQPDHLDQPFPHPWHPTDCSIDSKIVITWCHGGFKITYVLIYLQLTGPRFSSYDSYLTPYVLNTWRASKSISRINFTLLR